MDDAPSSIPTDATLSNQLAERLAEQRQLAEAFLATHREELLDTQSRLREQLQAIAEQVLRNEAEISATREELDRRTEELRRQSEEVTSGKAELEARSESWRLAQQETIEHFDSLLAQLQAERAELDAQRQDLQQQQDGHEQVQCSLREESQQLALQRQDLEAEQQHSIELKQRLETRSAELDALQKTLAERQTHTEIQRRKIAKELKNQRSSQIRDIERQRAEFESQDAGEAGRLSRQLKGVEQQRDSLKAELETLNEHCQEQARLVAEHTRTAEGLQGRLSDAGVRLEQLNTELEASRSRQAELSAELDQAACRAGECEAQLNASRERQGELAGELETLRGEATEQAAQLEAAHETERNLRQGLAAANSRQTELVAELETVQQRESEALARIDTIQSQHEHLKAQLAETRQRESALADQLQTAQTERDQAARQLEALRKREAELSLALDDAHSQNEKTADELRHVQDREAELNQRLESLQQRYDRLEAASAESDGSVGQQQYEVLLAERDQLAAELDESRDRLGRLEQRLESSEGGDAGDPELARRYEMAMDDVRELNQKITELQGELESAKRSKGAAAQGSDGGSLDWEAQKAKILAALENESEDNDPEAAQSRLRIDQVVKNTDRIVADKDAEILELQRLLQDQSNNLGSVAVGAAALGEMFDQDEIIMEERENLKRLQKQWEEKLRKAEIDLSVERAKIARERAELEERLRGVADSEETPDDKGPAKGGRWLARLGLKDEDS